MQSICGVFFSKLTFIWFLSIHKCLCSQFYYRCCCCCCCFIEWYIYQMKNGGSSFSYMFKFRNAFNFYLTNGTNQWASRNRPSGFQLHVLCILYYECTYWMTYCLLAKWKSFFAHFLLLQLNAVPFWPIHIYSIWITLLTGFNKSLIYSKEPKSTETPNQNQHNLIEPKREKKNTWNLKFTI